MIAVSVVPALFARPFSLALVSRGKVKEHVALPFADALYRFCLRLFLALPMSFTPLSHRLKLADTLDQQGWVCPDFKGKSRESLARHTLN